MAYGSIADIDMTSGMQGLFYYLNHETLGLFFPLIFFGLFIIIAAASWYKTQDFPAALTLSSFSCAIIGLFFRFGGFIKTSFLVLLIGLAIMSFIFLLLTKNRRI